MTSSVVRTSRPSHRGPAVPRIPGKSGFLLASVPPCTVSQGIVSAILSTRSQHTASVAGVTDSWWRSEVAPTAGEWSALFAGLTLLVAVVAAIVALIQYRAHLAAERSRTRPYVIVDYAFRSILMQVEIKNIGATAATDVKLSVDPPFESGLRDQADRLNAVFSNAETISMLAPGRRILYTFDRAPDYYDAKRQECYTIKATYRDLPTRYERPIARLWRRSAVIYRDEYPLDFRQWSQATTEADYDEKNWNIANRGEQREKRIANALESLVRMARERQVAPGGDWQINTVQDSRLVQDFEVTRPVLDSSASPKRLSHRARRGGLTSGTPRNRWIRRSARFSESRPGVGTRT